MIEALPRILMGSDETRIHVHGAPTFRMRRRADRVTGRLRAYEPASLSMWVALCRAAEGRVIDVGAYSGLYAHAAAAASPDKVVYAFEPFPPVYARLCENIEFSGLSNIIPVSAAVSDRSGSVELIQRSESDMTTGSSIVERPGKKVKGTVLVPTISIDEFVAENNVQSIAAVKIDVENAEHLVLAGMASALEHHRPHLIVEILSGADVETVGSQLLPLGYRCYRIGESDLSVTRMDGLGPSSRRKDRNCLCTTASANELAKLCVSAGLSVVT